LLKHEDSFNNQISDGFFFEKIKEHICSNAGSTTTQVLQQMEWIYFDWNPYFVAMNKPLSSILNITDANITSLVEEISQLRFFVKP
jgi:hypothetical protein